MSHGRKLKRTTAIPVASGFHLTDPSIRYPPLLLSRVPIARHSIARHSIVRHNASLPVQGVSLTLFVAGIVRLVYLTVNLTSGFDMLASGSEENINEAPPESHELKELREEIGLNMKQASKRLGVSYSAYRNWESGRSTPGSGYEVVKECLEEGDTLPSRQRQGDTRGDPIYDVSAEAGNGPAGLTTGRPIGRMPPSQSLSSAGRDVCWIPVVGDSMAETYRKNTLVPVAKFEDPVEDFSVDDVYVIALEGAIKIKRLQRLSGGRIRVISDNGAYPSEIYEPGDDLSLKILGRVLA